MSTGARVGEAVGIGSRRLVFAPRDATDGAAAFGVLVDRHHGAVVRYLTRQTGDPELAADLAQETFLAAFKGHDQLADEAAFPGWLFGIARNQLRMEWRRRRRRRLVSLDWLAAGAGTAAPALSRPDGSGASGERDRIQRVLDGMSPTLREALLLHGLCGFTGNEIAGILSIAPDAARKRIARAEAEFRRRDGGGGTPDGTDHHA